MEGPALRAFVTGSRRLDLLLFAALAAAILASSGALRVYHQVPRWAQERADPEAAGAPPEAAAERPR